LLSRLAQIDYSQRHYADEAASKSDWEDHYRDIILMA